MISSLGGDVTRYSARAAGARAFLGKPLDYDQLQTEMDLAFTETPHELALV